MSGFTEDRGGANLFRLRVWRVRRGAGMCPSCGGEVVRTTAPGPDPLYCSVECKRRAQYKRYIQSEAYQRRLAKRRRPLASRPCVVCGVQFEAKRYDARFCSERCRRNSPSARRCKLDGCDSPHVAKGLCVTHYNREFHPDLQTHRYRRAHEDPEARRESLRRRTQFRRELVHAGDSDVIELGQLGERDAWVCGICTGPVDRDLEYPDRMCATVDHVVPISKGGRHVWANVQLAHLDCNMAKGATTAA